MSLLFAQLTHAIGLNDVCDSLRHHGAKLGAIRGTVPPSRNTLSHANKHRNSDMMEERFWTVLEHLQSLNPKFGPSGRYSGLPRRFKQAIHAVDSTTIALVANCMDWAKHRRRKAAAKMHCSFMSCFDLSLSKAGGRIALPVCSQSYEASSGIASESLNSLTSMGQHDIDTACALALNPLTCRDSLHKPMGQQSAISDNLQDFCILTFKPCANPTRFNTQACLSAIGLMG